MPRFLPRKKLCSLSHHASRCLTGLSLAYLQKAENYKMYIYYEIYILFLLLLELRPSNPTYAFRFFRVFFALIIYFLCIHSAVELHILVVLSLLLFVLSLIFSLGKFLRLYKSPLFSFTFCCFVQSIYELYSFVT